MDRLTTPGWRKSTYSGNGGANCVETGTAPGRVLVRDTKARTTGPTLRFTPAEWTRFTAALK